MYHVLALQILSLPHAKYNLHMFKLKEHPGNKVGVPGERGHNKQLKIR